MLTGGVTTEAVVNELAIDLGKTKAGAGQILAIAWRPHAQECQWAPMASLGQRGKGGPVF